jgi:GNAT superfamily N-acetyltransferase
MTIRVPRIEEARDIAAVRVKTWRTTYQGIIPGSVLDKLSVEENEDFFRKAINGEIKDLFVLVSADQNDRVIAFVMGGKQGENDPEYAAEIYALYVLQSHQGQGIGRALVATAVERLLQQDYHSMLIWALAENPAVGFYQHLGGIPIREKYSDFDNHSLREIGFGWKNINQILLGKPG